MKKIFLGMLSVFTLTVCNAQNRFNASNATAKELKDHHINYTAKVIHPEPPLKTNITLTKAKIYIKIIQIETKKNPFKTGPERPEKERR